MKKMLYISVLIGFSATLMAMEREEGRFRKTEERGTWNPIVLPHAYIYPCPNPPCGNRGTKVYSTQFPTEPLK